MGSLSIWHWVIVLGVAALLFGGGGRLSAVMGDAAKGIRAFRIGLKAETGVEDGSGPPSAEQDGPSGAKARKARTARSPA